MQAAFWGVPGHLLFWLPDCKFKGLHNLLRCENLLEQLTELMKVL